MASTPDRPRTGGTSAAQTIASSGDRVRAFKSARRHSWLVRLMKLSLPVGALAAVGGYGALLAFSAKVPKGFEMGPTEITTSHLKMETPKYNGFGTDGSRYQVRAREAITDLKMSGPVRLNDITGEITQPTGVVTELKAVWGTYDTKSEVLELYDKIDIDGSTGMKARLTRATVFAKESRVISNERMTAEMDTGTIMSNTMILLTKARQAAFKGDVQVRLKANPPAAKPVVAVAKDAAKRPAAAMPGLAANSGQPIDVGAAQLDVDDTAKTALFKQNVVARQGDAVLEAQEMDVLYEGRATPDQPKAATPATPADPAKADSTKLKTVRARGNVVMTNKDDKVTTEAMEYDAATERVLLTGSVVMRSGAERGATADRAELDQKSDTALLVGNVIVTQAKNVMRGRRMLVDRKAGKMRLESPAEAGLPAGRINTLFYQAEAKPGVIAQPKSAPANPFATTFKTDPSAPIEIEADTLDVADTSKTALFKVNVIAKQGDFVLRTSEMTAFYTGQAMALTPGQPPAKKHPVTEPGQGAQLTRVEARNKVHITSKDGQTATGDWADFDVRANTVLLGGDVTVKQGQSVTTGSRIQIDLTTGEVRNLSSPGATALISDAPGTPPASKGAPAPAVKGPAISAAESGTAPTCPPGIVCKSNRPALILYPEEHKAQAKQRAADEAKAKGLPVPEAKVKKPKSKAPTADSAWDATTQANPSRQP
ncbi:MAG: LptA/OstA family protein [Hyphomicrobiaceae bacterium]